MSVDADTVRRIAHLARIAVTDEEVAHLQGELNAILAFFEQLAEVDVENVEPMTSVTPMEMKKRPDVVTDGGIADDIVKNAPATEELVAASLILAALTLLSPLHHLFEVAADAARLAADRRRRRERSL